MEKESNSERKIKRYSAIYLGLKKINKQGDIMEIIEYNKNKDILVKFLDSGFIKRSQVSSFTRGSIYNPYFKEVYGVGFLGESDVDRKSYQVWRDMMKRCYDGKKKEYNDCFVCKEWHNYSNFKSWFQVNYYKLDNNERVHLDKDILIKENRIYCPRACVFTPQRINDFFVKKRTEKRETPLGVSILKNGKYKSGFSRKDKNGVYKYIHFGTFENPTDAFYPYKKAKEEYLKEIANEYKQKIPKLLYNALITWEVEIND